MKKTTLFSFVIYNISLFVLIGWSIWFLGNGWPLLGLLASGSYKSNNDNI